MSAVLCDRVVGAHKDCVADRDPLSAATAVELVCARMEAWRGVEEKVTVSVGCSLSNVRATSLNPLLWCSFIKLTLVCTEFPLDRSIPLCILSTSTLPLLGTSKDPKDGIVFD